MFKFVVLAALVATAAAATFKPRLDGRIVGGSNTAIETWPHQVSLQYYGSHICGGSILSDKWIITAAHCTDGSSASDFSVLAAVTSLSDESFTQRKGVKSIHQHPNFSMSTIDWDISLLELDSAITLGRRAQTVLLPDEGSDPSADQSVVCTGWGATSEGGSGSDTLQAVYVNIVGRDVCNEQYGSGSITERMICAGVPEGGKDACQGDSGGPLVLNDGMGTQVGIVSWGYGCARQGYAGVYSNIGALRSFIKQTTGI